MYDPFVRACNYALHKLSKVNVGGLPEFEKHKQIVFVRNHDRAVMSGSHLRNSRVRPDIVLLQWNTFKKWREHEDATYSRSYNDDICVSKREFKENLTWRQIRSTVEMKLRGLSRRKEWTKEFESGFYDLVQSEAYISLDDAHETRVTHEPLPENSCECASFQRYPRLTYLNRSHPEFR
jgi:hypothetical protein